MDSESGTSSSLGPSPVTARFPHTSSTPPTSPVVLAPIYGELLEPLDSPRTECSPGPTPGSAGLSSGWGGSAASSSGKKSKSHGTEPGASTHGHRRSLSVERGRNPVAATVTGSTSSRLLRPPTTVKRRGSDGEYATRPERSGVEGVRRVVGERVKSGLKRKNLPMVIVFLGCLIIFFSALAGMGYAPDSHAARSSGSEMARSHAGALSARFELGRPVHEGMSSELEVMAERRRVEEGWAKKKRPQDGAWMKQERNDGAIRRKGSGAGVRGKGAKRPVGQPGDTAVPAGATA